MTGRFLAGAVTGMALFLVTASGDAGATTFAEMTLDQFTDVSTLIVEGHVDDVWTELDPTSSVVWTRARVTVASVHKGIDPGSQIIIDSAGGRVGDYEVYVPGMAPFSEGEDIFVFLAENGSHLVPVSKFQGKYTIRRAPGETRSHVMLWENRRTETFDARFLPHPAPEDRVYLDDLREAVRSHLDVAWDGRPIPGSGLTLEKLNEINTPERRIAR